MTVRINTLIAAYRENPRELERVIEDALQLGPVYVLADAGDYDQQLLSIVGQVGVTFAIGSYGREREKRQALLQMALNERTMRDEWFLVLDPDEKLSNGDVLPLLLDRLPADQLFYPLLRVEPHGEVWEMPCKLFRNAKPAYAYLDVGIRFGSGLWNLDPWHVGKRPLVPGWPLVTHYASPRANRDPHGFYSDEGDFANFPYSYREWRQRHEHPGGYLALA